MKNRRGQRSVVSRTTEGDLERWYGEGGSQTATKQPAVTPHDDLRALMVDEICDLYDAERQLAKILPKMAQGADSMALRAVIENHANETDAQLRRLERAFELLHERPRGRHCAGIAGVIEEESEVLDQDFAGAVRDAAIIAGAQRAEHYEIGAYGTVIAWAKRLGEAEVAALLHETLEEEKSVDERLSALAESRINPDAASGNAGNSQR